MGLSKSKISDDKLLVALLASSSISGAAAAAGCGQRTIYRRLQDQAFTKRLEEMRLESLETARNALLSRLNSAVDTMADVMENAENGPSTRLSAARMLVDSALRMVEVVDVERRLDELERRTMAQNGR